MAAIKAAFFYKKIQNVEFLRNDNFALCYDIFSEGNVTFNQNYKKRRL